MRLRRYPASNSGTSGIARSPKSGATRRLSMPFAGSTGCASRAAVATGAKSISAAAAARRWQCSATPARPTRRAICRRDHGIMAAIAQEESARQRGGPGIRVSAGWSGAGRERRRGAGAGRGRCGIVTSSIAPAGAACARRVLAERSAGSQRWRLCDRGGENGIGVDIPFVPMGDIGFAEIRGYRRGLRL